MIKLRSFSSLHTRFNFLESEFEFFFNFREKKKKFQSMYNRYFSNRYSQWMQTGPMTLFSEGTKFPSTVSRNYEG